MPCWFWGIQINWVYFIENEPFAGNTWELWKVTTSHPTKDQEIRISHLTSIKDTWIVTHTYVFLIHVYWWYRQYTQKHYGANKTERRNWKGPTTCTLLTTLPATAVRSDFPDCSLLLCEANSVQHVILRRGSLVVYQCQLHVGSQHYQRQELILRINIYNF